MGDARGRSPHPCDRAVTESSSVFVNESRRCRACQGSLKNFSTPLETKNGFANFFVVTEL